MTRRRAFGATATPARLRPFGAWARQARLRLLLLVAVLGLLARPAAAQTEVIEYYGHDALGPIRIVFTASGVATARADYEPFGEAVTIAGMPAGPLPAQQFTGHERDALEHQDYFGARYYRPRHGRFSQVDPVYAGLFDPQQWNRYAYARNNPLGFVDPDGKQFVSGVSCPSGGNGTASCPWAWPISDSWFNDPYCAVGGSMACVGTGTPLMPDPFGYLNALFPGGFSGIILPPGSREEGSGNGTVGTTGPTTTTMTTTVVTTTTTGSTTTAGSSGAAGQPGGTRSSRPLGITVFAGGCVSGGLALGGQGCAGGRVGGRYGSPGSVGRYLSGEVSGGNRTIGIGLQIGFLRGSPDQFAGTAVPYTVSMGPVAVSISVGSSAYGAALQVFPVLLPSPFNAGTAAGVSR